MRMTELENDERFNTPRNRRKYRFELQSIIEKWMAVTGNRNDILKILKEQRVPAAPVLTLSEAIEHPHAIKRGAIRKLDDPFIGSFPIQGNRLFFLDGNIMISFGHLC